MNRVLTRLGFTTLVLASGAVPAVSQTVTTGGATGIIRDTKGNPVAGAHVSLQGQVKREATSATDGTYRLGLLNPGEYFITVSKEGYQAFKSSIVISVNQTHTVNASLAKAAEATVVVVGAASTVDFTNNQTGLTVSMDAISAIPKPRDFNDIAYLSPGVVTSGRLDGISISGASALENSFIVDGVSTNDMRKGFQGSKLPTDFVDQVEVQTGGLKPEYSAMGGVFNAVTKSGSNEFAGSGWFNYDANTLGVALKNNQFFQEKAPKDRYDLGFSAGGAILRDKLFYFVGGNSITTETPAGVKNSIGLVNDKDTKDELQIYAKLNYYVTPNNQLTFTAQLNDTKFDQPSFYSFVGNAQFGYQEKTKTNNFGLSWDWTISSNLLLSVKGASTSITQSKSPSNTTDSWIQDLMWTSSHPGTGPAGVIFNRGGFGRYQVQDDIDTQQLKADLQWFLGNHSLKFGINTTSEKTHLNEIQSGPTYTMRNTDGSPNTGRNVRVVIRRSAGAFNGIDLVSNANKTSVKRETMGYYAQDTWEMLPGFRVAYGARFDAQEIKDNDGRSALKFDNFSDQIQPRFGITWDLNNDGKTKISANYARYFLAVPMQPITRVGGTETYLRNRYSAANSTYNATTGAWTVGDPSTSSPADFGIFFSAPPLVEGTKLTKRDEYILGVDHTLANGWTLGLKGQQRELTNPIEDSVIDLGDGYSVFWNPHPGPVTWTQGVLGSNPGEKITFAETGYPTAFNIYQAVTLSADKKTANSAFNLSYTISRLYGNYEGVGQASNGQADALITSTFDYYTYVGKGILPSDRTHVVKAFGSHTKDVFGNPFTFGYRMTLQSGTPLSLFDDGSTTLGLPPGTDSSLDLGGYGNAVPDHGKYGNHGRTPYTAKMDITLEYAMKFGRVKVIPNINVFNILNKRTPTRITTEATDANGIMDVRYNSAAEWLDGRSFRFGVKAQF